MGAAALAALSKKVYEDAKVEDFKTNIGIVATRWILERPMIFKANIEQVHGRKASFAPFFGVPIGDAVQASCSAYPYFNRKIVVTDKGDRIEVIDGGFCANNPTLYAIADATVAMKVPSESIRVVSLGVRDDKEGTRRQFCTIPREGLFDLPTGFIRQRHERLQGQ